MVDDTGKLLDHQTIYLVQGGDALERSRQSLREICRKFAIAAVAVGNGTHGRETEDFVRDVLASAQAHAEQRDSPIGRLVSS